MRKVLLHVLICLPLCGIAWAGNPINMKTALNYFNQAQAAEARGDYATARIAYSRSLANAKLGDGPPAVISMLTYNAGRMEGYACNFAEAEKLITDALNQEEKISGPESGMTSKRLFELARLNFDRSLFAASLPYFERGIPMIEKLGIEGLDPIGFAGALDDFAKALHEAGQEDKSAAVALKAKAIREKNPDKKAGFVPVRYNQNCPAAEQAQKPQ